MSKVFTIPCGQVRKNGNTSHGWNCFDETTDLVLLDTGHVLICSKETFKGNEKFDLYADQSRRLMSYYCKIVAISNANETDFHNMLTAHKSIKLKSFCAVK